MLFLAKIIITIQLLWNIILYVYWLHIFSFTLLLVIAAYSLKMQKSWFWYARIHHFLFYYSCREFICNKPLPKPVFQRLFFGLLLTLLLFSYVQIRLWPTVNSCSLNWKCKCLFCTVIAQCPQNSFFKNCPWIALFRGKNQFTGQ